MKLIRLVTEDENSFFDNTFNDSLTLNAKYKYTFRTYEDNPTETNAVRKSFSAGFDYQF